MKSARIKIEDVRPELRKAYKRLPTMNLKNAFSRWLLMNVVFRIMAVRNALSRKLSSRGDNSSVSVSDVNLGTAKVRIYAPSDPLSGAGLLWIHGGGMIGGKVAMNDAECTAHAQQLNVVVVSVEYRVAPKHPYPAAIDDCYSSWLWFQENAERLGVNPERIAIAGQSAGGGLTAALCQRILDASGTQPAAQCLYYPMLDDRTAARKEMNDLGHFGWHNRNNHFGWRAYLGQPPGSPEVPPWGAPGRREDLSGLPPAWIGIGDLDLFFDESKSYADRLGCEPKLSY